MSDGDAMKMNDQFGTHNYHPLPVNIVRGENARVWDGNGKEYIDCIGAYSAVAHGHLNEAVVEAIHLQLAKISLTSRAMYNTELALFLACLTEFCEMDKACPMNTGAEANETAIKLARKWAYTVKGIPRDKAEIIVTEGNFHGRTTTIVGFSSELQYKEDFGPYSAGFPMVPFNDIAAVEAAITPNTCAFFAEPIQAEGGVIVPDEGYLAGLRKLCDKHNILLILDEVQTGFARTGKKFAWMHEDAKPDMITVGKPLGGGILAVAAVVGMNHVMDVFKPGDHGSTFGGNSLSSTVATAALAEMVKYDYCQMAETKGAYLRNAFANLDCPFVLEIRGKGLLIGLEFSDGIDTDALAESFIRNGILTKETRHRTFRFAPPITSTDNDLEEAIRRIKIAINEVSCVKA